MNREIITTENAPQAFGPYSQGIKIGSFVFTSGQISIDPKNGNVVTGDIKAQTKQALENLKAVLTQAGSGIDSVIKVNLFIKDMNEFNQINEIYSMYFQKPYPARTCVEVSRLPKDVGIEIEAIGHLYEHE